MTLPKHLRLLVLALLITASAGLHSEQIFQTTYRACAASAEHDAASQTLRLRVTAIQPGCDMSAPETRDLLDKSLAIISVRPVLRLRSIALGRVIDHLWLSRSLMSIAARDLRWSRKDGKPNTGNANDAVNRMLSTPAVMDEFAPVLARYGYLPTGMGCEKVLVVDANQAKLYPLLEGKQGLPYDAQCWLRLSLPAAK